MSAPAERTPRLHYDDPLRLEGEAEVRAIASLRGAPSVILDRTIFYPESGGQMGDHGAIGEARVVDVQLDDGGRVHHLVEGPAPEVGARVGVRVDGARRRAHMALHTGQHALSRALLDHLGAVTRSSRLGASACTIDVDVDGLDLAALAPVEDAVNALIDEDRPVVQRFVDDDAELARLSLRKPPPETDRVRVVEIEGYDVTPCGGTHVTHTAQIELLFLQSVERYKGGSRITFECGPRARRALRLSHDRLVEAASGLRCAPAEVDAVVAGLRAKLDAAREESGALRARLADAWLRAMPAEGPVVASIEGADPAALKALAARLAVGDRWVVLGAPEGDATHVLVARGPDAALDCGGLLKRLAAATGGRGGGRPDHAQGRLPGLVDLEALVGAHA